jgi:ATP-dependent RNA helicase DeaD
MTTTQEPAEATEPKTFDDLPLSSDLRRALADMDYKIPTPVQIAVFESAAAGRDLVVQARTGTGKTTAFGLPVVDRLVSGKSGAVQALILCPTRELALQVARELERLAAHMNIVITAVYGGAPIGRQIDALDKGSQVVVGTPGRVLDHLRRGTMDASKVKALVLDEADEMLSMGFEKELTSIIERLPDSRQTLLFSATVPPDIERMAKRKMHDPEFVILSGDHVGALQIEHYIYNVTQDKPGSLRQIIDIEDPESAIVFCNTKVVTQQLSDYLNREGFEAAWLNGDLQQSDRERVMRATREGRLRFLVATDVAARGIDISHLTHVINYDFPQDAEAYVHRTGRTGRAGNTGTAISLATPQDVGGVYLLRLTYKIRPVERRLPSQREQRTRAEADIVTSLADTFAARGRGAEHRSLARRLLSHEDAESVVAGMLATHLGSNPELPELAESRRRAKNPEPVADASKSARQGDSDKRRKKKKKREDDAPAKPTAEASATKPNKADQEKSEPSKAAEKKSEPKKSEPKKSEPKKSEPKKSEPKKSEPKKTEVFEAAAEPERPKRGRKKTRTVEGAPSAADDEAVAKDDDSAPEDKKPRRGRRRAKTRKSGEDAEGTSDAAAETAADEAPPAKRSQRSAKMKEKKRDKAPTPAAAAVAEEALAPGLVELHLDLGRKDSAKIRMIKSLLADAGITPDQVHRLRMRDRHCYVEIDQAVAESAREVLDGADLGDRKLTAEISKRA